MLPESFIKLVYSNVLCTCFMFHLYSNIVFGTGALEGGMVYSTPQTLNPTQTRQVASSLQSNNLTRGTSVDFSNGCVGVLTLP